MSLFTGSFAIASLATPLNSREMGDKERIHLRRARWLDNKNLFIFAYVEAIG